MHATSIYSPIWESQRTRAKNDEYILTVHTRTRKAIKECETFNYKNLNSNQSSLLAPSQSPRLWIIHLQLQQTQQQSKPCFETKTHLVSRIRVGTSIQQQPHAVRVTIFGGTNQCSWSALRAGMTNVPNRSQLIRLTEQSTQKSVTETYSKIPETIAIQENKIKWKNLRLKKEKEKHYL